MSATPMPKSAQPLVSIPFNLYFHGLDKPHWSAETDGFRPDPDAQRRAEKSRQVAGSARRRRVATLHDSIKRLEKAVYGLSELDETGFTDVAAQHLERRLANTVSHCRSLLGDIAAAVDTYRTMEVASATPPSSDSDLQWEHDQHQREEEELAASEADDLAADARAADQVITALAARTAKAVPSETDSFPTPADIAKGAVTTIRRNNVWPPQ
ncbi:hypothetical protein ACX80U_12235 [Arthrobacter sp. TmT3-37]